MTKTLTKHIARPSPQDYQLVDYQTVDEITQSLPIQIDPQVLVEHLQVNNFPVRWDSEKKEKVYKVSRITQDNSTKNVITNTPSFVVNVQGAGEMVPLQLFWWIAGIAAVSILINIITLSKLGYL